MKHLTIYALCLLMLPAYAEKGLVTKLKEELNLQVKTKDIQSKVEKRSILSPDNKIIHRFYWNESQNDWEKNAVIHANYNAQNELIEEIEYTVDGTAYKKSTYTFDASTNVKTSLHELFYNGSWIFNTKEEVQTDVEGNIIREELFTWNNNEWIITNGYKIITTTNDAGDVFETDYEFNVSYIPVRRRIITYNSQLIEQITTQYFSELQWINIAAEGYDYDDKGEISSIYHTTWDGQMWQNEELYTNITWYNFSKKEISLMELKIWDGTTWISDQKIVNHYKINGSISGTIFKYENFEWKQYFRVNEEYDVFNNPKSYKIEKFDNNAWVVLLETENEYKYDNEERLISAITKMFDGSVWMNLMKEETEYKSATGINTNKLQLTVYPNPSSDYIKISGKENAATINIYSLSGQLVQSENIENLQSQAIDISGLQNGFYLVEMKQGDDLFTCKLLKK